MIFKNLFLRYQKIISLEKFLEAYDEQMPFHCINESTQHEWLMSIENMSFNVKNFKYSYIDRQRSKSVPYDENNNEDCDWQPCCSGRQSRADTRKSVAFSDEVMSKMISEFLGDAGPNGLSTPIEESPEKKTLEKPSCIKKNLAKKNEEQVQENSALSTNKRKIAIRQRGKSENRTNNKVNLNKFRKLFKI